MPYVIQTFDKPNHGHVRVANRAEHRKYLEDNAHRILASGGMMTDDGGDGNGAITIVDTEDRQEAEKFIADDPFSRVGLFERVVVTRWRKAFFDRKKAG